MAAPEARTPTALCPLALAGLGAAADPGCVLHGATPARSVAQGAGPGKRPRGERAAIYLIIAHNDSEGHGRSRPVLGLKFGMSQSCRSCTRIR